MVLVRLDKLQASKSNATLLAADLTRQKRGLQNRRTKIDLMTKNFRYQFPRLWSDNSAQVVPVLRLAFPAIPAAACEPAP